MGIKVEWDDLAQTTIRVRGEGEWTWLEFRNAASEINAMIDTHGQKVGMIVDRTREGYTPPGNMLNHFQHAMQQVGDRVTIWTIVSPNGFARKIINVLLQLQRNKTHRVLFVASVEEARARVAEVQGDS